MMGEIHWGYWVGFLIFVGLFLALDLGIFHRQAHVVSPTESLLWTLFFVCCALLFAFFIHSILGKQGTLEFITGYVIELSLSMDNVFVIAMIFRYFQIPRYLQHRVLFWGILGAIIMRGVMICIGIQLVKKYEWIFYIFGVFLVFTGIKMLFEEEEEKELAQHPVIKFLQGWFPVTHKFHGQRFMITENGKRILTPLALALAVVEATDLIFAMDSIPAIFAITTNDFIVFTSNVFAVLGLRSLYFLLENAINYFVYLRYGLSIILGYVGLKMLMRHWVHIPTGVSLSIVIGVIGICIVLSLIRKRMET